MADNNDWDDDDITFRKLLGDYCKKLRAAGYSEAEIHRAYDIQKAKLIEEDATRHETAPAGLSRQELNLLNAQRALEGLPDLVPAEDDQGGDRRDLRRDLNERQLAGLELERASLGQPKLKSDQIAKANIRRATGVDGEAVEFAPRGMHKAMRAKLNLERACRGEPELLPHPDDEGK
jgi:hypothetical protein